MGFDERLGWLLLGMLIGYIIRILQDIRKEGHEVHDLIKKDKNESGFMRHPLVADIALVLVVALCVYASFSTQITNNRLESTVQSLSENQASDLRTQKRLGRITVCTEEYLSKTIEALNERTQYNQRQSDSNVRLQQSQRDFLELLISEPPISAAETDLAIERYISTLREFVDTTSKQRQKTLSFPYPTEKEFKECLSEEG